MSVGTTKQKSLGFSYRKVYKPFLKEQRHFLGTFELIKNYIPQEVTDCYVALKVADKWWHRKWVRRYESLAKSIEDHNAEVTRIKDVFDSFDYRVIIRDPSFWDEASLKRFADAARDAKSYSFPFESPFLTIIDQIEDVTTNIAEIRRQFGIKEKMENLISSTFSKGHVRHDKAVAFAESMKALAEELGEPKKSYYDFSDLGRADELVGIHNEAVARKAMDDDIFDDICGHPLSEEQRRAAVSGEKNTLVIASAGSGKTTTVCGRVKYLLERQGVKPEEILLLSYSKKSAEDLVKKVESVAPGIRATTFHKTGLDILVAAEGSKFAVEEQYEEIIETYFRDELVKDPLAMRDVFTYYGLFLNNGEGGKRYKNEGERFEELKHSDFITIKDSLAALKTGEGEKITLKKERVKSFEELAIANFYFINGIDYEYERPYEYDESTLERRQYTPDFYLKDYHIYHEHYGINREGRAPQYEREAEIEYLNGMKWKRLCHERHHTTCIETYSYEVVGNTLFDNLTERLKERGVEFHPISDDMIKQSLESFYHGQSFASFINLVATFISLYKARYSDETAFDKLLKSGFADAYSKARARLFLSIAKRVYLYYSKRVHGSGKIDFDDMILRSTSALPSLSGFRYKHIIVDEFQDISYSRAMFLKALSEHGNSDLFCVGDDWQSIYRFSGSDLSLFLNFETYFGYAERHSIGEVYRNSQQLQDAMKRFIEQNPEQIKKEIVSSKSANNPIRVVYYDNDPCPFLRDLLSTISSRKEDAEVLLLGRNNRDIKPFLSTEFYFSKKTGGLVSEEFPKLRLNYSTVHGSKGLEAEYVILLSAKDAPNGFPNKTEDDPLLNLVMSRPSLYPFAEERRLWYVALTRTKSYTFILAPANAPSQFLLEMGDDVYETNPEKLVKESEMIPCPRCKGGHLVRREDSRGHAFYGCSNYPYCAYTIDDFIAVKNNIRCPNCGDFMVKRKGQHGIFYGCHSYPRCRQTIDIKRFKK